MIELIGLIGIIAFGIACLPFAVTTAKAGRTDMPLSGISAIVLGSFFMFVYETFTSADLLRLINFGITGGAWTIVLYYRLRPRLTDKEKRFMKEYTECFDLLLELGETEYSARVWLEEEKDLFFGTSAMERIAMGEGQEIIKWLEIRAGKRPGHTF